MIAICQVKHRSNALQIPACDRCGHPLCMLSVSMTSTVACDLHGPDTSDPKHRGRIRYLGRQGRNRESPLPSSNLGNDPTMQRLRRRPFHNTCLGRAAWLCRKTACNIKNSGTDRRLDQTYGMMQASVREDQRIFGLVDDGSDVSTTRRRRRCVL